MNIGMLEVHPNSISLHCIFSFFVILACEYCRGSHIHLRCHLFLRILVLFLQPSFDYCSHSPQNRVDHHICTFKDQHQSLCLTSKLTETNLFRAYTWILQRKTCVLTTNFCIFMNSYKQNNKLPQLCDVSIYK